MRHHRMIECQGRWHGGVPWPKIQEVTLVPQVVSGRWPEGGSGAFQGGMVEVCR